MALIIITAINPRPKLLLPVTLPLQLLGVLPPACLGCGTLGSDTVLFVVDPVNPAPTTDDDI